MIRSVILRQDGPPQHIHPSSLGTGAACSCNAIGAAVAASVLYMASGILFSPAVAALAMSMSSVPVTGNASRLRAARL